MTSEASRSIAEQARNLYESELRERLELDFPHRFVCIEPISKRYFIGDTFDAAVNAAIDAIPDRLTYTLRIGHQAAIYLGVLTQ